MVEIRTSIEIDGRLVVFLLGRGFATGRPVYRLSAWGFPYFSGQLKTDPVYREKLAAALRGHAWLTGYRGWLSGALDGLDVWMGRPHSLRALRVCGTIAMVYASAFLLVSWALGGPGTIGTTPLLPVLPWWQQAAAGMAGLILFVGFAWIALRHQQVDAALERGLARFLRKHVAIGPSGQPDGSIGSSGQSRRPASRWPPRVTP